MTSAEQTYLRVARSEPAIEIARFNDGTIAAFGTSTKFVEANFRHIVNRRMRWSDVELFVRQALHQLTGEVNTFALGHASLVPLMEDVVDVVRDAANRRRAWATVEGRLNNVVVTLIDAARRCR
jgi:hypothetical protein